MVGHDERSPPKKMQKLMDDRRQDLLNRIEAAADKTPPVPEDFYSPLFQIMYGLPMELQLRLAVHMGERYLPIYETKWPNVTWPRTILGDLDAWFRAEGEATPDEPDDADSADAGFQTGLRNLVRAYYYRDDPACLTSGTCAMIHEVISVRAENVFLADDAVAARLEKEERAWSRLDSRHRPPAPEHFEERWLPEHELFDNVAFQAVYRRERLHVVEWLRAEAVWKYPEPDDLDAMMRALKRWDDNWLQGLWPEGTTLPEDEING